MLPRQVAMYLCHDMLGIPYKRISTLFDKNDHTTAINACKRVEEMIVNDSSFSSALKTSKSAWADKPSLGARLPLFRMR